MARPLRIEYEGALHHITSRGNARASIFFDSDDFHLFLETFSKVISRYGWICHTYCLMPNHYHLLVETPSPNLSRGMQLLNGIYTQKFNCQHKRSGHVFQGRFKAILENKGLTLLTAFPENVAVGMPVARHPRTDPGVRNYRTGLLPRVKTRRR